MPKWCSVPNCRTGSDSEKKKWSVFRVPRDSVMLKKWEAAIPGILRLNPKDIVCEKHFSANDVAREWIKFDAQGQVIARAAYKYPQLSKFAVPTIFNSPQAVNSETLQKFAERSSDRKTESPSPASQCFVSAQLPDPSIPDLSSAPDGLNTSMHVYTQPLYMEALKDNSPAADLLTTEKQDEHNYMEENSDCQRKSLNTGDINSVSLPASSGRADIGMAYPHMEISSGDFPVADLLDPKKHAECLHEYMEQDLDSQRNSVITGAEEQEEKGIATSDLSAFVPEPWIYGKMLTNIGERIVFLYMVSKTENSVHCPVTQKSVTLDADGTLTYFVYGRHVDTQGTKLERVLKSKEMLQDVLNTFLRINVCSGLGNVNVHLISPGAAFQDYLDMWRSKDCVLISKKKRCDFCVKSRKCIQQRASRLKSRSEVIRVGRISNPVFQHKLSALRMKIRRERRQKLRAKDRVKHLMKCLEAQEEEMASMHDAAVDEILVGLDISSSQKLVLKEIVAAAKKKDATGRRYTDEWIMLCMLLSIRSPREYKFLRNNNILPLPCMRTIRSYFSLIKVKCGFDDEFGRLLKKHFDSKSAMQRHGVLLIDEINLRKSVAVCSRNLNYQDLTDFGEEDRRSTDIREQATHGLVVMFQPLADVYTQPIAVFASKNPVKGDELAKMVVKAISYLEQCGAMVDGVIADGATTNAKMWSILGVTGTMEKTETWFTHPMDDDRKVFVFSDICHVVKNVRNRLFNKKKLRDSYYKIFSSPIM